MSAVSNSVTPRSIALWITLREVSRSVRWPKLLQPRPTAETRRPEPPRLRICMDQFSKFLKERMIFRQTAYTLANHALGVEREKGSHCGAGPSKLQDGSPMALMQVRPVPIAVREIGRASGRERVDRTGGGV